MENETPPATPIDKLDLRPSTKPNPPTPQAAGASPL